MAKQQRVVVFDDSEGRVIPYATAYTNEQADDAVADCEARPGRAGKPRILFAFKWPPERLARERAHRQGL